MIVMNIVHIGLGRGYGDRGDVHQLDRVGGDAAVLVGEFDGLGGGAIRGEVVLA